MAHPWGYNTAAINSDPVQGCVYGRRHLVVLLYLYVGAAFGGRWALGPVPSARLGWSLPAGEHHGLCGV